MKIEKKCWPEQFEGLFNGARRLDLRLADFKVKQGDTFVLREWDPKTRKYSGRELKKKIREVLMVKTEPFYDRKISEHYGLQVLLLE
ncbi:MAG: hypothetical protein A2749_02960 [Parcubacteria group bacterium RIFCSPHIGHO2_01_FULL_45_26]|nr:MAG: hypothetical protein A2749_02960 [Parcubacteria group bacterium RIFCSPHIGHO2_01_FULL_45_26]